MTLPELLREIEQSKWPIDDGSVTHLPAPSVRDAVVLGFTNHIVVAADVERTWLAEVLPPGDPSAAFNPPFLGALAARLGRRVNNIDVLTLASPISSSDGDDRPRLSEVDGLDHPRVRRARRYREDMRIWTVAGGVLTLGRGVGGRWEAAIEVEPAARGKGVGRALARAARRLVPDDRPVWAQVAPGNAASLRAFLAAGFAPVGEEALLVP